MVSFRQQSLTSPFPSHCLPSSDVDLEFEMFTLKVLLRRCLYDVHVRYLFTGNPLLSCMYVCVYVCMYVCMYIHTYVCMYVWCIHKHAHAQTHRHPHLHAHTHTHTHTGVYTQGFRVFKPRLLRRSHGVDHRSWLGSWFHFPGPSPCSNSRTCQTPGLTAVKRTCVLIVYF